MDSNGLPPITTDEQLRAWLLELDKHQPAHVLQVCSGLMTTETGDPSKSQRKLVKQVIASHKAGDGGIAHALKGLFGVFSLSKVGWQVDTATISLTKYMLLRYFKKFPIEHDPMRSQAGALRREASAIPVLPAVPGPGEVASQHVEAVADQAEVSVFKVAKVELRTKHQAYDQDRELHYGVVLQRVDAKQQSEQRCAVLGQNGSLYSFRAKDMEEGQRFMLYVQVVFQLPDVLHSESIPYSGKEGYRGSYVAEITTTNRHLLPGREFIDGIVGPKMFPDLPDGGAGKGGKGGKGGKQRKGGAFHEIHIVRAINDKFTKVKYWPRNDFVGDLGLVEGDRVQLTTLVTSYNKFRYPTIDQMTLDYTTKERDVKMATDPQLQARLHDHHELQVRYELGCTTTSSTLPGFPAALEGSLSRQRSQDLIYQMLTMGQDLHERETRRGEHADSLHAVGLRRLKRASSTKLTVLINPFTFNTIAVRDWPRLIDTFFNGRGKNLVDKFVLMTRVHEDTDEHNFHTINDFDYRFQPDVANRLCSAHIVDHVVFGRGELDIFNEFEVHFKDYGDSPRIGLLVFTAEERAHTYQGTVTTVASGRLLDAAEENSLICDHYARETVITVSYETGNDGRRQRDALNYLRELSITSVPKRGAPLGWQQRHVRCSSYKEAQELLSVLLSSPDAGENPLLAIIDSDFANNSLRIKFDSSQADINHLFMSITGRIPAAPVGDGSFVCLLPEDTTKFVLSDRCLRFNSSCPPYSKPNFASITDRSSTYWLIPPKMPARMLRATMGPGPGHLLVPNVSFAISLESLKTAIMTVFPYFVPGETACDFVALGSDGGLGVRFWVPDKGAATLLGCRVPLGFLSLPVEDGDLRMTTMVQAVFSKAAPSRRRKGKALAMGTPTSKRVSIARSVGLYNLKDDSVAVNSRAVSSLLREFKSIEVAGARGKDKGSSHEDAAQHPLGDEEDSEMEDAQYSPDPSRVCDVSDDDLATLSEPDDRASPAQQDSLAVIEEVEEDDDSRDLGSPVANRLRERPPTGTPKPITTPGRKGRGRRR